ncbi:V-type ATP synthase subunit I [Candidatus Fermentibacteria bacterium]|nr:V-type ATP synthase subunit I [Candidatus Fermentibacteria bacterium]
MAVQQLKRVYVVVHAPARDGVVAALQDAALVHLEQLDEGERDQRAEPLEVDTRDLDRRMGDLDAALDYLGRYAPSESSRAAPVSRDEFLDLSRDSSVDATLAETRKIQGELAELDVRETRLRAAIGHVQPWRALPVPLEWLRSTPTTTILCGSLPSRSVATLRAALSEQGTAWIMEEVSAESGKTNVVLADLVDDPPDAERLLREAGYQPMLFPASRGTVAEVIQSLQREGESLAKERETLKTRVTALALERVKLMAAYDDAWILRQRLEGLRAASKTRESVIIAGWAKANDVARISALVEREGDAAVLARDPLPGEEPPVVLRNAPLVAPCQAVTGLYGMPKYQEIDPTPLLAPFFVACFGIAVGEAGYGIILAVLSKLAKRFMKLSEGSARFMDLMFYCGIATFVAGMLMGSFFAIDFASLPPSLAGLATLHDRLILLDPLKQPLPFLGFVLALGFLQVWTGVLIGGVVQWRSGDRLRAVLYSGGWMALLPLTAVLLIRPVVAGIPLRYPWMAAAASVFVGAGLGASSVGGRIGSGLFALYGITGFFGDVLSYSRLFALGLATGVMASVINILAAQAKNIPVVGWGIMALILVVGHPANLAINALGAFVHSARLQFVEFFTKFFEGGGRRFEPFARRFRYIQVAHGKDTPGMVRQHREGGSISERSI